MAPHRTAAGSADVVLITAALDARVTRAKLPLVVVGAAAVVAGFAVARGGALVRRQLNTWGPQGQGVRGGQNDDEDGR